MASRTTPESLLDRPDVDYEETTRSIPREKYEALRERYQTIDGVVQVGVCDDDAVLLVGPGPWAPPGGNVKPNEDWEAAGERVLDELCGVDTTNTAAELVERTYFTPSNAGDEERFPADVVTMRASLDAAATAFRATPTIRDGLDHPIYGDGSDVELAWFDTIPADVHENHEHHVRRFLD